MRVLVVDDHPDAALVLGELLRLHGHEVALAHDGLQALGVAADFEPQAVLLDLGIPGIDGHETCRRLRATRAGAGALILAVTGWSRDEDRERSRAVGFDGHLVKPVDPDTLLRLLAEGRRP